MSAPDRWWEAEAQRDAFLAQIKAALETASDVKATWTAGVEEREGRYFMEARHSGRKRLVIDFEGAPGSWPEEQA